MADSIMDDATKKFVRKLCGPEQLSTRAEARSIIWNWFSVAIVGWAVYRLNQEEEDLLVAALIVTTTINMSLMFLVGIVLRRIKDNRLVAENPRWNQVRPNEPERKEQ